MCVWAVCTLLDRSGPIVTEERKKKDLVGVHFLY